MHLDRIVDHGQSWFHAVSMAKWICKFQTSDVMSCLKILARSLLKEKKLSKQLELSTSENDKLAQELEELEASLQRFSAARMSRMLVAGCKSRPK